MFNNKHWDNFVYQLILIIHSTFLYDDDAFNATRAFHILQLDRDEWYYGFTKLCTFFSYNNVRILNLRQFLSMMIINAPTNMASIIALFDE